MYYLVMPAESSRRGLIDRLKANGITSVFHYLPLHLSPMGRRFGGEAGDCPVTESVSDRLVRLPFYNDMTASDQEAVIRSVTSFTVSPVRSMTALGRPSLVS